MDTFSRGGARRVLVRGRGRMRVRVGFEILVSFNIRAFTGSPPSPPDSPKDTPRAHDNPLKAVVVED